MLQRQQSGRCCLRPRAGWRNLWLLPPVPSTRLSSAIRWGSMSLHLYLYGCLFTIHTDHQALTTLLSTPGTGQRPLRLHRWSDRLCQYNFELQFTPGRLNVVADPLSRSVTCPAPHTDTETMETDMMLMVHSPHQATVSLQELKDASEAYPVLSQLCTYIRDGWPYRVPEELLGFCHIKLLE